MATKQELEMINEALQFTLKQLKAENQLLSDSLTQATSQIKQLKTQYETLSNYVKSLQHWASTQVNNIIPSK